MADGDDTVVDLEKVSHNAERLMSEILVVQMRGIETREIINEAKAGVALATSRLASATEQLAARLSPG